MFVKDLRVSRSAAVLVAVLWLTSAAVIAQQNSGAPAAMSGSAVPHLVNYSGVLKDASGKPVTAVTGLTFLLFPDQQGGSPVWMETQNVTPDKSGRYTAQLGATRSEGLPASVFMNGEGRWLAVQPSGEAEQPRVLLVAVPYAMKAADAETVGGLPPSAFVLAAPATASVVPAANNASTVSTVPLSASTVTTSGGTANTIPLFTTATNIQNSAITQTGTGSTAKIGIGTTAPAGTLDIKGSEFVRGAFTLPSTATATAAKGANSQPEVMTASAFNSSTAAAVNQNFQLQAEPASNNTSSPSGTLNLLFGTGTGTAAETGLKINNKGQITFAAGQTFPGGSGTVTSVGLAAPTADFTVSGSPVTTTGTLKFAWTAAPTSNDTANAIVKRDGTGSFKATSITGTGTFATTTANANALSGSTSLDGGSAIVGSATATGGSNIVYGVVGNSVSTVAGSTGALGLDGNTAGTGGFTMGVQGVSRNPIGLGVLGFAGSNLSSAFYYFPTGAGVWGDGGASNSAVIATTDDGVAGSFANNSASGKATLGVAALDPSSWPFVAFNLGTGRGCSITSDGDLICSGTKNAVVPIDGGKRKVAMSAIESPQNWFEDAGSAELVNGSAVVALDPDFIHTVNTALDYKVFPVPNGDCKGLYVTNKTATSFEVRELGGGTASVRFDYRIMALRKNYEKVRFADHTNDPDPKKMMEEMKARRKSAVQPGQAEPAALQKSMLAAGPD